MSESRSMLMMMGSKLKLEILTLASTGVGATYRYSGRMLGLTIDVCETVMQYIPGRAKLGHIFGEPQLLIVSHYEIGGTADPLSADASRSMISFGYELPRPHRVAAGRHRCHEHSTASPSVPLIMVASAINTLPAALPASRTVGPKAKSP
jgi:hypothetical protein